MMNPGALIETEGGALYLKKGDGKWVILEPTGDVIAEEKSIVLAQGRYTLLREGRYLRYDVGTTIKFDNPPHVAMRVGNGWLVTGTPRHWGDEELWNTIIDKESIEVLR